MAIRFGLMNEHLIKSIYDAKLQYNDSTYLLLHSSNGVFVGVGFMEGSVAIYIAFSLQVFNILVLLHLRLFL